MTLSRGRPTSMSLILTAALAARAFTVLEKFDAFVPGWGGEMASVASSLAAGAGFASPYWTPTGPTALVPPAYPMVLSLIFRVFGNHRPAAGIVALGLGIVVSAATCVAVARLGRTLFDDRTGLLAAWIWALAPLTGWTDALFIWNTPLFTWLLTWFVVQTFALDRDASLRRAVALGVLGGVLIMVEAAALPVVGLSVLALLVWHRLTTRRALTVVLVVAILPSLWLYRNYQAFHEPIFLRSGLGLQLAEGMHEGSPVPTRAGRTLPGRNPEELARYRALGEPAYMRAGQFLKKE